MPGQEMVGNITVRLFNESIILTGCDQEVDPTATILKFNDDPNADAPYTPIPLSDIAEGDRITFSGIPACNEPGTDYNAFIILDYPPLL